jgi:hypothetical protein
MNAPSQGGRRFASVRGLSRRRTRSRWSEAHRHARASACCNRSQLASSHPSLPAASGGGRRFESVIGLWKKRRTSALSRSGRLAPRFTGGGSRSVRTEPHLAWPPWTSPFTRASLPHDDQDASLAFYRDTLGFEARNDVEYDGMHWITVGPADQPDTSIVLYPPAATPASPTTSAAPWQR